MKKINIRPIAEGDRAAVEEARITAEGVNLEIPYDYAGIGVDTAVAEKDNKLISSLTGKLAVIVDPLIIVDKEAAGTDVIAALIKQEAVLTYIGAQAGALESYIAVPKKLAGYIQLLKNYGYEDKFENCVVLRRPLVPERVGSLEKAKEQARAVIAMQEVNTPVNSVE